MLSPLQHDALTSPHGFFTRKGGVSKGIYAGLNTGLGSADNVEDINTNRRLITDYFGAHMLVTNHQIHSANVCIVTQENVTQENAANSPMRADALVTSEPNIILGVLTADCAPILFEDAQNNIIGAAHAGWQGAFIGVLENTRAAMETLGAQKQNIRTVIGPCISQSNYEVGAEFLETFLVQSRANEGFFKPAEKSEHYMFDLQNYICARAKEAGFNHIQSMNHCTYADESQFFSYRRSYHKQETDYGRQLSAICVKQL